MEPEDLENKEFLISLRGYDREEVDAFLRDLAAEIRTLKAQVSGAPTPEQSPATAAPAREDALRKVGEETSKILLAAEQVADDIKGGAKKEAAELLADARHSAELVHRQIQDDRKAAEEDLRRLKDARAVLATQLEDVRRRLDETIARLTAPMELPRPADVKPTEDKKEAALKASPKAEAQSPAAVAEPAEAGPEPQPAEDPVALAPAPVAEHQVAEPEPEVVLEEPQPEPEPEPEPVMAEAETVVEPSQPELVAVAPEQGSDETATLSSLLQEIREEREKGRAEFQEAMAIVTAPAVAQLPDDPIAAREALLGDLPQGTARRMKRLLQEDQNILLDRIRTARGKGSVDDNMPSEQDQVSRFADGLSDLLGEAFRSGRKLAGSDEGDAASAVENLVTKQLVAPLRAEVVKVLDAGLADQDTATAIGERASDIFRVWKGVRTELLGEGMTYAAFHQGLLDAWGAQGAATKQWVFAESERECPRDVCKTNAAAGPVAVGAAFPSGHGAPPAHGGCECTLKGPGA